MATVTGLTAARMIAIEAASVVGGTIDSSGHLILTKHDGSTIDAGDVSILASVGILDSATIDFGISGAGTPASPFVVTGTAKGLASQFVTDWNNATLPGFYHSTSAANSPTVGPDWWIGEVKTYDPGGRIVQELRQSGTGTHQNVFVRYWGSVSWTAWQLQGVGRGSSSARDAMFGVPSTDATKSALANQKVQWFNTDLGWEESYYAVTGTVGLTAPALVTGSPSGWYPTGNGGGPSLKLFSSGGQAHAGTVEFSNWKAPNPSATSFDNESFKRGTILSYTGSYIESSLWGRYKISGVMSFPSGSGVGVFALRSYRTTGTPATVIDNQIPVSLLASYGQTIPFLIEDQFIKPGDHVFFQTVSATWTIGSVSTWLMVEYIGPPLRSL